MGADDLARRDFILLLGSLAPAGRLLEGQPGQSKAAFENKHFQVSIIGNPACLWSYRLKASGSEYRIAPPVFNVDKVRITAALESIRPAAPPARLKNGATEYRSEGAFAARPSLSLAMAFQAAEDSPIVRFSYRLKSSEGHTLTKPSGQDDLTYLGLAMDKAAGVKEIRLANFSQLSHSYLMEEVPAGRRSFEDGISVMGPILISSDGRSSMLLAYEHGSQVPDAYLQYKLGPDFGVSLEAVKGNYLAGRHWDGPNVRVRRDRQGRAVLNFSLDKPGAKIVFFGVE